MKYSKEKIRQIRGLMLFAAILILVVIYSESVFQGIGLGISIIKPFILGGVIAFIVNLPMKWIENRLFKKWQGKSAEKLKRPLSLVLALVLLALVITAVVIVVVPQLTTTVRELGKKIPIFLNNLWAEILTLSRQYPELQQELSQIDVKEFDWESILSGLLSFFKNGVGSMVTSTIGMASSIIGGIVNGVISFIFSLYILSQKEKLADQGQRIVRAYASEKMADRILRVLGLLNKNFTNFVTGQCLEAIILGVLFIIAMTILGMPYAVLVGVLIAFTALIPIVGAFIGCGVGAFLILIDNPMMALWFVIMFLVIQQLEGNLIYPKVVGNSVGLPAIWILMAVSLGGSLFGVAGMLFFIPLLSTCYGLLRENVNYRNHTKQEVQQEDISVEEKITEEIQEENGTEDVNEQVNSISENEDALEETEI